jgi:hypothetical protein
MNDPRLAWVVGVVEGEAEPRGGLVCSHAISSFVQQSKGSVEVATIIEPWTILSNTGSGCLPIPNQTLRRCGHCWHSRYPTQPPKRECSRSSIGGVAWWRSFRCSHPHGVLREVHGLRHATGLCGQQPHRGTDARRRTVVERRGGRPAHSHAPAALASQRRGYAKELRFGVDCRNSVLAGADKLADAVQVTLGPKVRASTLRHSVRWRDLSPVRLLLAPPGSLPAG